MVTYNDLTDVGYQDSEYQDKSKPKGENQFKGKKMEQKTNWQKRDSQINPRKSQLHRNKEYR